MTKTANAHRSTMHVVDNMLKHAHQVAVSTVAAITHTQSPPVPPGVTRLLDPELANYKENKFNVHRWCLLVIQSVLAYKPVQPVLAFESYCL